MRILLVGHEGYVGSGLRAYFEARGHEVAGWGRRDDLFRLDAAALARLRPAVLVNCAAVMTRVPGPYVLDGPDDRVNAQGARHLSAVLRGSDALWVQLSTREVYGPVYGKKDVASKGRAGLRPRFLVDESRPFAPETPYAKSKLVAELLAESRDNAVIVRLSTCYTDLDHRRGNWMVNLVKAALKGEPAPVTMGGRQFRDPLHSDDLGRLIEVLVAKRVRGIKLNVGGGRDNLISVGEFLRLAVPNTRMKRIPGGDLGFAFDNALAKRLTGWTPRVQVRDRIPVIVENVRRGLA